MHIHFKTGKRKPYMTLDFYHEKMRYFMQIKIHDFGF